MNGKHSSAKCCLWTTPAGRPITAKARIIKKRLSTKSSPLLIRELKKLRVASPKSKVQQRINTKKIKTLVVEVQNCFNFEPLSKGGSVVAQSTRHRWRFFPGVSFWYYFRPSYRPTMPIRLVTASGIAGKKSVCFCF